MNAKIDLNYGVDWQARAWTERQSLGARMSDESVDELTERAEAAERELADLRLRVCRGDLLTIGLTPEDTVARLGWTDLYREGDDR